MLRNALHMFSRSLRVRTKGFKEYKGDANQICEQIIADCWNGFFFQASTGHFSQFWCRDFGMQVESLRKLGWKSEVRKTLEYAVNTFARARRVTTTIDHGRLFEFPSFAPDSLAFLLLSLSVAKQKKLVMEHADFFQQAISDFVARVINKNTSLVREHVHFSSMKDHAVRSSSCYDNVMSAIVARESKN